MKTLALVALHVVAAACLQGTTMQAQNTPDVVWEAITPNSLANSIAGVDWSPVPSGDIVFGSTDRWLRTRQVDTGALSYSVLQPHRSGGVHQAIYSSDGTFIAVHNSSGGIDYRVHRAVDGFFLGLLAVTLDGQGLIHFTPDSQLISAVGGDGTLSRWQFEKFTVIWTVGSGYDHTNTTFNFSPDGSLQSAASQGAITIRRRGDASIVRTFSGGSARGVTPAAFTPDSSAFAAWNENSARVTLWRIADGTALMNFPGAAGEGVGAIRFFPNGTHLVTTGYFPFLDGDGLWQQKGMIRFWRVADGALRQVYDAHTGLGVTSAVAWSPDTARFAYGTYEGTAVVARTPAAIRTDGTQPASGNKEVSSLERLANGNVLLHVCGNPGAVYHVEASTNLTAWKEVGLVTANSNGYCELLDTTARNCRCMYYRAWRGP